ncbi:MAG: acetate--CoA ligase family protein, partial [Bacillota bacterium]|nr:acetate--CoA ligase family protein [Bacillota bacterium]
EPLPTAEAILEARRSHPGKPVVASFIGGEAVAQAAQRLTEGGVPCFAFPEPAVSALASLVDYAERARKEWNGQKPDLAVNRAAVEQILAEVRREKRRLLLGSEAARVVEAYGVPVAPSVLARSPQEAARAAQELGFPVVLKLAAPQVQHKTDLGGVRLNLRTPEEVEQQYEEMVHQFQRRSPAVEVYGVEIQPLLPPGRELIVGMVRDHQFGPMLMFGLGGIYVNLFRDVSFRAVHGLTKQEIETMIRETKAFLLLRGARGEPPADLPAVVDVLSRVARLVSDFPELMELDINPLFAYEKGVAAVDVKITWREVRKRAKPGDNQ